MADFTTTTDIDDHTDERMMTRDQVVAILGISYSTVYQLMREDRFPLPLKLSRNRNGWLQSEIIAWLRSRPRQRYKPPDVLR
jgi:prophage regulatory protein